MSIGAIHLLRDPMAPPFFSVVMAVQNAMPDLPASLQSILNQTFTDFEVIMVDDHSTDETLTYLQSIQDKRLRLFAAKDRGQTPALNQGIQEAKADWIVRMDGDDWSDPRRFMLQREAILASNDHPVLISSDYVICDEDLNPIAEMRLAQPNSRLRHYLEHKNNPFCHPTVVFHREAGIAAGLYDNSIRNAQDYHFWLRLLVKANWAHVSVPLLKYRVRRGSLSVLRQPEQTRERLTMLAQSPTGTPPVPESTPQSTRSQIEATYHYKLGFAAWIDGKTSSMSTHFLTSIRAASTYRWKALVALGLGLFLPRKVRLSLAGYRGIYL